MGEIGPQPREGLRLMKMARDSYGAAGRVRVFSSSLGAISEEECSVPTD